MSARSTGPCRHTDPGGLTTHVGIHHRHGCATAGTASSAARDRPHRRLDAGCVRRHRRGRPDHRGHVRHAYRGTGDDAVRQGTVPPRVPGRHRRAGSCRLRSRNRSLRPHRRTRSDRGRRAPGDEPAVGGVLRPSAGRADRHRHHRYQGQDHHRLPDPRDPGCLQRPPRRPVLLRADLSGRTHPHRFQADDAGVAGRVPDDAPGRRQRHALPGSRWTRSG